MRFSLQRMAALSVIMVATAIVTSCADDEKFRRTESNDLVTEPAIQEGADGVWRASLSFDRLTRNRQTSKAFVIRQSGVTDLVVTRVYIEGAEDCDLIKAGLSAGSPLPGELDRECQLMIADGPVLEDGRPHFVTPENPLILGEDNFVTYSIKYKATQDMPPEPAKMIIESNALGKERVEVELSVLSGRPQIAVTPTTVGFPAGTSSSAWVNVRNAGSGELSVNNWRIVPTTPAPVEEGTGRPIPEFRLSETDTPPAPWLMEENRSQQIQIEYVPVDEGSDSAQLIFESNDTSQPEFSIFLTSGDLRSELQIQPNPLVFPPISGPGSSTAQVTFTNSGLKDLSITEMVIEQDGQDYSLGNEQNSFQLQGGRSRAVSISYLPALSEGSDATLVVTTNADNVEGGQATLRLLASAEDVKAIGISPVVLSFDNIMPGTESSLPIQISNSGGLPVQLTRIATSTSGDSVGIETDPHFTITSGGDPVTVPPGGNHEIMVRFQRPMDDVNHYVGAIIIESDAETSPDSVSLNASAPVQ